MSYFSPLGSSGYGNYSYSPSPLTGSPKVEGINGEEKWNPPGIKENGEQECETCKNRKYQDGSDEMVSFKSPSHIDPRFSGTMVRAHEQEHVSNAYTKASEGNGKVLNASVALHTSVCPECGTPFVAGGTTTTKIKYNNEENPYEKARKTQDYSVLSGKNAEYEV